VETADGRVVMLIRTVPGPYLQSVSDDGGRRWSTPTPITLVQPRAPAHIDRIPGTGDLVCLWGDSVSDRYPLSVAVSRDGGHSWTHARVLERATAGVGQYAYPTLLFHDGRALMTYYVADAAGIGLAFRSIPIDRLLRAP